MIAQEVAAVVPEVVQTDRDSQLMSVDYGRLVGILIEAMKEQQRQLEEQGREIRQLRAELHPGR